MPAHESTDLKATRERLASTMSGFPMLIALVLALAIQGWGIFSLINENFSALPIVAIVVGVLAILLIGTGFYMLQPNEAAAITLFGDYRGTDRTTGLRWVWPWMMRPKVSIRIHNFTSDRIKVNDLRGNPIEIAANVVWRVTTLPRRCSTSSTIVSSSRSRWKARSAPSARNTRMTISSIRK